MELRPCLRALDLQPWSEGGDDGVLLTDPEGLFDGQVFVPRGLIPVLATFNGAATCEEIARQLSSRHGQAISADAVRKIADDLDRGLCLEGERARGAKAEKRAAWDRLEARPARHAGSAGYPANPAACRARLDGIVERRDVTRSTRSAAGLIAPHIDLARGEDGYGAAYGWLAGTAPADLYVLFGTSHCCPPAGPSSAPNFLVPTRKDFVTPLGTLATDREFVDAVAAALGPAPFAHEMLHGNEHSLEFQVLFLRHVLGERPARIAPFLTGHLGAAPDQDAQVQRVVAAIAAVALEREHAGARVVFVAGADLSHQGPFFGDPEPVGDRLLANIDERDRASLALVAEGRAAQFVEHVEGDGNTRRICGTAPIYWTTRLVQAVHGVGSGHVLDYGQAVASDRSQVVSYAAVAYAR